MHVRHPCDLDPLADWTSHSQFRCFTGTVRVCRVSKVRVGITVSVRIMVSLVLVIGWVWDFPTWSEWRYMSGSRPVATAY